MSILLTSEYENTDYNFANLLSSIWNFHDINRELDDSCKIVPTHQDFTIMINNEDTEKTNKLNKYTYLMANFLINKAYECYINKTPEIKFSNKILSDCLKTDNILKTKKYLEGFKELLYIRVAYKIQKTTGTGKDYYVKKSDAFISSLSEYDEQDKYYTVKLGDWILEFFNRLDYKNNRFIQGNLEYKHYIADNSQKPLGMDIPKKILSLYRINQNKLNDIFLNKYKVSDYLYSIYINKKSIRRKDIEKALDNINTSLSSYGLSIELYNTQPTPKSFIDGYFKIKKI